MEEVEIMKHTPELVELTNMCVIEDANGNVVALDKVSGDYNGTTFPGGHIEKYEVFSHSMIREIKEETGLTIHDPKLKGVYHWYRNDIHNILFVYYTTDFEGKLLSSEEGRVYWVPLEELKHKKLATGSEHVITMIENNEATECVMVEKNGIYTGKIY